MNRVIRVATEVNAIKYCALLSYLKARGNYGIWVIKIIHQYFTTITVLFSNIAMEKKIETL